MMKNIQQYHWNPMDIPESDRNFMTLSYQGNHFLAIEVFQYDMLRNEVAFTSVAMWYWL